MCRFCDEAKSPLLGSGADAEMASGFGNLQAEFPLSAYQIPDNPSTGAVIQVGGTRVERLDYAGDEDWFRLDLAAGQTVQISLDGVGGDALSDPYLRLYDSDAGLLAFNDDGGPGLNSRLVFTADRAGSYFIEVDSFIGGYAGDYRLSVVEVEPPGLVDSIKGVTALDTAGPVYVYFARAGDRYTVGSDLYIANGVNTYERDQLWSIFEGVERFADIDFRITTSRAQADLEWATDGLESSLLGFFFFPTQSGEGGFGLLNDGSGRWSDRPGGGLDRGGFMYGVAIHELGHGLGLGHTHDGGNGTQLMQGVSWSGSHGDFDLNQTVFTAMSYNDGWVTGPNGQPPGNAYGYGASFGAIDIAALQEVYGANTSHAGGDDIYRLDDANGPDTGYATIWDTGGFDTMLYQGARDVSIDLRAATLTYREGGGGFVSYAEGVHAGLTIAHGVVIEAAESGAGDDSLGGNGADNWLTAGAGDDTLRGHGGDDWLDGGTGGDFLNGGAGLDTVMFVNAAEGVKADLASGKGSRGEAAGDLYIGIEDLIGGRHTDDLRGDAAQNRIEGGNGADGLHGRQGDDELVGGGGSDRLYGNLGADLMTGGSGFDRFVYFAASDSGIGQQDRDRITDFEQGKDRMDLAHLFDRSETSRDDQLALIGGARFSSDAGELRYFQNRVAELTIVEADLDGDGSADLQIELAGLLTLVREDFLL